MEFTIIIDNTPSTDTGLAAEHGFSLYFEADGLKWMVDVGATSAFSENAEKLGIDLTDIDALILSHAHADHTGGLRTFLEKNRKSKIYLSGQIDGRGYFSARHGGMRDISIDVSLLPPPGEASRFVRITENTVLSPSVRIIAEIPVSHPVPKADSTLYAGQEKDDFSHEIAVEITSGGKTCLISSCSHKGLLNTLESCHRNNIVSYIGGLHLLDSDTNFQYESRDELLQIARTVKEDYPELTIYTGHCTGKAAKAVLSSVLGDRIVEFHTGYKIANYNC